MTEIERAQDYAASFIRLFKRMKKSGFNLYICDPEFIWEEDGFQELVIQQIRIHGYKVFRKYDDDGLALALIEDDLN